MSATPGIPCSCPDVSAVLGDGSFGAGSLSHPARGRGASSSCTRGWQGQGKRRNCSLGLLFPSAGDRAGFSSGLVLNHMANLKHVLLFLKPAGVSAYA